MRVRTAQRSAVDEKNSQIMQRTVPNKSCVGPMHLHYELFSIKNNMLPTPQ